jgi:hypothetical protein
MPGDNPEVAQIVWPTKEEVEKGLAKIERYESIWKATPALLVIKPHLGLIVSLENIKHDEHYFALTIAVEKPIVAPEGFDAQNLITLKCVWNQPYISLGADLISAPYSFYLHFGAQGVQRARELSAMKSFDKLRNNPMQLGLLRSCFQSNFQLLTKLCNDDTG